MYVFRVIGEIKSLREKKREVSLLYTVTFITTVLMLCVKICANKLRYIKVQGKIKGFYTFYTKLKGFTLFTSWTEPFCQEWMFYF